jgi:hypothetical protein
VRLEILQNIARQTRESLGEPVEYKFHAGKTVFVDGVFQETATQADPNGGAPILISALAVSIVIDDLNGTPSNKDRAVIRGITYRIVGKMETGRIVKFELQGV